MVVCDHSRSHFPYVFQHTSVFRLYYYDVCNLHDFRAAAAICCATAIAVAAADGRVMQYRIPCTAYTICIVLCPSSVVWHAQAACSTSSFGC